MPCRLEALLSLGIVQLTRQSGASLTGTWTAPDRFRVNGGFSQAERLQWSLQLVVCQVSGSVSSRDSKAIGTDQVAQD
jgi:hypothetical protein